MLVEFIKTKANINDICTLLEFGMEQTPRICHTIIEKYPFLILNIDNHTPELCIEVLRRCYDEEIEPLFLEMKVKTPEVCMEAIKRDGWMVFCMENPSDELWLTAISMEPEILSYIRYPSYDLCLEAVRRNSEALKYIEIPEWRREIKRELKPGVQELIQKGKKQKSTKNSLTQKDVHEETR